MEVTGPRTEPESKLELILVMEQAIARLEQTTDVPTHKPLPLQQESEQERLALQEHRQLQEDTQSHFSLLASNL